MKQKPHSDQTLVQMAQGGDQAAFGQLVERYQSPLCALAYSAIGDLALSEDLAQEVFIAAWKNLSGLREASKWRAWLFGIARNRIRDFFRNRKNLISRQSVPIEDADRVQSSSFSPTEEAVSKEEEAILWQNLETMPENYREPMVLFYREQQSITRVAEILELSEDTVKQRLSRGRELLKKQIARFVEGALARSGPKKVFTVAVLAALPTAAPQSAAGAVAATATKGSGAAKATGWLSLSGAVWGPVLGVLGGVFGSWMSIRNTRSPRERKLMVQAAKIVWTMVAVFILALCSLIFYAPVLIAISPWLFGGTITLLCSVYIVALIFFAIRTNQRQKQIQIEDGTFPKPGGTHQKWTPNRQQLTKGAIYGSMAGAVFGFLSWLVAMAVVVGDWNVALLVLFASLLIYFLSCRACLRSRERYFSIVSKVTCCLVVLNLLVVNYRWDDWLPLYRESPFYNPHSELPLWIVNLLIIGVGGTLILLTALKDKNRPRNR